MIEVKAPNKLKIVKGNKIIFLAGSIEMGLASDWAKQIILALKDEPITFLNPRRDNWDSSWKQEITNPQFKQQVTWELNGLEISDIIVLYLEPKTKSPISLLELGLFAKTKKLIVCCPEGFWRKGNVDIVCEKYGVKQVSSIEEIIESLK